MELTLIATVVFFLALGINTFWPQRWLQITYGIAAILLAVLALIGAGTVAS